LKTVTYKSRYALVNERCCVAVLRDGNSMRNS